MAPTIFIVPGFWEGPESFSDVSSQLSSAGHDVHVVKLPSTGTKSPGNPSMDDDIAAVRQDLQKLVEKEGDIVLLLHSAGGFLGSNAMEGFSAKARKEKGLKGGVNGIVFLSGAVFPQGFKHGPLPFATVKVCSEPLPSQCPPYH